MLMVFACVKYGMGGGRTDKADMAFKNNDYPYGATISYGLFVIILLFSILFFKVLYAKKED